MQHWFERAEYKKVSSTGKADPADKAVYIDHVYPKMMKYINRLAETMPVVSPVRHPFLIAESWARRAEHTPYSIQQTEVKLVECLLNWVGLNFDYVVPVDNFVTRQFWFDAMKRGLELNLETDWQVRGGVCGTHKLPWQGRKPSKVINQFYEETKFFWDKYY
jgi:hypothetical protein